MRIAQITDTHMRARGELWKGRVDPAATLARLVAALNRIGPDLVVHTGDVADSADREDGAPQYAVAADILSGLKAPLRLLPGNHDTRAGLGAAFGRPGDGFLGFSEEARGLRLVGLDTLEPGRTGGRLCADRLKLLEAVPRGGPVLIFMHHPPCPMGLPFMDGFPFEGGAALARAIAGREVLRIACGHVHADVERHWAGTLVSAAPAASAQLPVDLPAFAESPRGLPAGFTVEPLRIRLHDWDGATLTVKTVMVEAVEGPYPFPP
ncbi:MAG: 3',5'-cyclic adenosine monophosphate phosphodiesterase CpdA [Paracoccaceae bacterium]|nr:MAG: 3',5'-cyclic adenosine monophosphate phosphodiesterase CpdA [Paracoccaceae bacterium]